MKKGGSRRRPPKRLSELMEPSVVLVTVMVVLVAAVVGFMAKLRKDVSEIHVMVNSRMSEAMARIDQLNEALKAAGIASPTRPPRNEEENQ